ncbi:MAG: hypothetical protein B6D44_00550 [Ignavibacteriales bacterium UTCHB2]|jgi:ubiquinone/menaquinone biosynthesis C-methylase UbiE|nr:class I SAM-dependent methyltransferase [Bacteroidia bacterium]OQY75937.1 MAG: hypothetical protein B6D44_00550 [Ignavibacteriales bacterium UTCHB2]
MAKKSDWTGERLETNIFNQNTLEHLHRYSIALNLVQDKTILDIACGTGYGTNILASRAKAIVGIDVDEKTIEQARYNYRKGNIEFKAGSITSIPYKDNYFDVVVSFETVEHIENHELMMSEIKRVLKADGILIMSSPDKLYYSDIPNYKNVFHLNELYENNFKELIEKYFNNVMFAYQSSGYFSIIIPDKEKFVFEAFTGTYNSLEKIQNWGPLYWIAIASENIMDSKFTPGIFSGNEILSKQINQNLITNRNYRLGKFLLSPFKLLSNILKWLK